MYESLCIIKPTFYYLIFLAHYGLSKTYNIKYLNYVRFSQQVPKQRVEYSQCTFTIGKYHYDTLFGRFSLIYIVLN